MIAQSFTSKNVWYRIQHDDDDDDDDDDDAWWWWWWWWWVYTGDTDDDDDDDDDDFHAVHASNLVQINDDDHQQLLHSLMHPRCSTEHVRSNTLIFIRFGCDMLSDESALTVTDESQVMWHYET